MYWSKWESFYASSIQLLEFSTFTGIFDNHLRFDVKPQLRPQPQSGVRPKRKIKEKIFPKMFFLLQNLVTFWGQKIQKNIFF
jgi:hypothetical protein